MSTASTIARAVPVASGVTLERNLRALGSASPKAIRAILDAAPRSDALFQRADDGAITMRIGAGDSSHLLASAREPMREGSRLAETAPVESATCIVVLGFGAGHHVAALARRVRRTGLVIVFEPDAGLLRAAFERIDHAADLSETNLVLLCDSDAASITSAISGLEGLVAGGVKFLEHPASRRRLGGASAAFTESLTQVVRAVRTNVITSMVQADTTLRNLLMNIDRYATGPGIADLSGAAAGRPAIVVSAGPSLERNIDLLAGPGVRERFVIIAAQTVLKKLLARGIEPHFVTALDYHEISTRFYEGLTPEAVRRVALVAEPKANPAILSAFPGVVRCPGERLLDDLLGRELARSMGQLTAGATVAHLAYYLARHLGCDPVILVGQDLGFTDGQYYHAGAAIHQVWAGELNEFNTLETMEWQRIVRNRHNLVRATDHLGRPIYTDEQMSTYLVQFERDFAADASLGRRVIDATEGGVSKHHTTAMTLRDALDAFRPPTEWSTPGNGVEATFDRGDRGVRERGPRPASVRERVASVRRDAWKIAQLSRATADRLSEMSISHSDQRRVNELIEQVHRLRDEVVSLQPAYGLVGFINQTGGFNRFRADRAIELDATLTPIERQKRQIDRDATNVRWIADAADHLGRMLDQTLAMLDGGPRITRDPVASGDSGDREARRGISNVTRGGSSASVGTRAVACGAIVACLGGADERRDPPWAVEVAPGLTALALTLSRLSSCSELDGVVLARDRSGRAERIVASLPSRIRDRLKVRWITLREEDESWMSAARHVRGWSARCWRGGVGGLTVWDELARPRFLADAMRDLSLDAVAIVGPDWCAVDPALTDAIIARHRESPEQHPLTFSPTAPGFAPCVAGRELIQRLADNERAARTFSTIGGVLGYVPAAPRNDPIAKPVCVEAPISLRDFGRRAIFDSARSVAWLGRALRGADENRNGVTTLEPDGVMGMSAVSVAAALSSVASAPGASAPIRVIDWHLRGDPSVELAAIRERLGESGLHEHDIADLALTVRVSDEAIADGRARRAALDARRAGFPAIHVRGRFACDRSNLASLVDAAFTDSTVTIFSVDLVANDAATYAALTGVNGYAAAERNTLALIELSRSSARHASMPTLRVVPRIERRDEVYGQIEAFYDRWLMEAGACVIDPCESPAPGSRIMPLPRPSWVDRIAASERLVFDSSR